MNYKTFTAALNALVEARAKAEEAYIENGGEVTEETEELEAQKAAIADLLQGEGIDYLGRRLKAMEDQKQAIKNEKAKIAVMEKACDRSIDFIKEMVGRVLRETDTDKAKGVLYSFSQYTSDTVKANTEAIKDLYAQRVKDAMRDAGIPAYITATLGASSSLVPEGEELPDVFVRTVKETCKFVKPRNVKEV